LEKLGISFTTTNNNNPEALQLLSEIRDKAKAGHWKSATRKLKRLSRQVDAGSLGGIDNGGSIPKEVYDVVLQSCMADRLHGARASESVRKIMEQMIERFASSSPPPEVPVIPDHVANYCIKNCLGHTGIQSTHEGFGGVDTAYAMLRACEQSVGTKIEPETYDKVCLALAKDGSVCDAMSVLRKMVVDLSETPSLPTFAAVAEAAVKSFQQQSQPTMALPAPPKVSGSVSRAEDVLTVLAYVKAAGYELDGIASVPEGQAILAAGVVAAEKLDNVALGLRLLTAAANAKNVRATESGDVLVTLHSPAAQRAAVLIHKQAILRAVKDRQWKLAVRVFELMLDRGLPPSTYIWRSVVTCCAKAAKSKKAASLLLEWVKRAEEGKADKPPLSVFNTCVNACEICNEQELTLSILDAMKRTHETEGNLITFNIALKRLAKLHDYRSCEGIIIGMLQADVEPSVVSYTTAIAACASKDDLQPLVAVEWLRRMRSRNVSPNVLTYNTALATCLDGTGSSFALASQIAASLLGDVEVQISSTAKDTANNTTVITEYTDVIPDASTKLLCRRLLEQFDLSKPDAETGEVALSAMEALKIPLQKLADFDVLELSKIVSQRRNALGDSQAQSESLAGSDQAYDSVALRRDEMELEFAEVVKRSAEV
jgi:pentatricopeptide repeat protein